jgi:hypothetical protein
MLHGDKSLLTTHDADTLVISIHAGVEVIIAIAPCDGR